ncbi:MAG: hypothetical protein Q7W02_11270 [Candidatus Rokubacteria bacterium]|nr:hypothetical protein [Candidatus Rokubacteria bacterium]
MLTADRYTKAVLTFIAMALVVIAIAPIRAAFWNTSTALFASRVEAQTSARCPSVSAVAIDKTWRLVGAVQSHLFFEAKDSVLWAVNYGGLLGDLKAGQPNCVVTKIERN